MWIFFISLIQSLCESFLIACPSFIYIYTWYNIAILQYVARFFNDVSAPFQKKVSLAHSYITLSNEKFCTAKICFDFLYSKHTHSTRSFSLKKKKKKKKGTLWKIGDESYTNPPSSLGLNVLDFQVTNHLPLYHSTFSVAITGIKFEYLPSKECRPNCF